MTTEEQITTSLATLHSGAAFLDLVLKGPETGEGSEVPIPDSSNFQITLAKAFSRIQSFTLPADGIEGQSLTSDGQGGSVWVSNATGANSDDELSVSFTGSNFFDGLGSQQDVNNAVDAKLKVIDDTLNNVETPPSEIEAKDLISTVPTEIGQRIVTSCGVEFEAIGTEAGDWDFYNSNPLVMMGGINERQGLCNNTGRSGSSVDTVCAIKNGIPFIWGRNRNVGAAPVSNFSNDRAHTFNFRQHDTRPHPDYDRRKIGTVDKITRVKIQHNDFGQALSESGILFGWNRGTTAHGTMSGADSNMARDFASPIFFENADGTNQPIRDFDTGSQLTNATTAIAAGLYIGTDASIWVMTSNFENLTLDVNLPTSGTVAPIKITKPEWENLTPQKVRVSNGGQGFLILFTDGSLWAAGANDSGQFGLGNTSNQNDFVQIASDVADFDIAQEVGVDNQLCYYLTYSGDLFGAGDNGSGWLGNGNTTNVSVFDLIDTGVQRVVSGGYGGTHALAYLKNGIWHRVGENSRGTFGNSSTSDILVSEVWVELNQLIAENGKLLDIGFGGYYTQETTICAALFQNGKIFAAGEGSAGQLGDGRFSDSTVFVECEYQNERGESPVSLCFYSSSVATPTAHFGFTTNKCNLFLTGQDDFGLTNGGGEDGVNANYSTLKKVTGLCNA